jgi:hypothetical protein
MVNFIHKLKSKNLRSAESLLLYLLEGHLSSFKMKSNEKCVNFEIENNEGWPHR